MRATHRWLRLGVKRLHGSADDEDHLQESARQTEKRCTALHRSWLAASEAVARCRVRGKRIIVRVRCHALATMSVTEWLRSLRSCAWSWAVEPSPPRVARMARHGIEWNEMNDGVPMREVIVIAERPTGATDCNARARLLVASHNVNTGRKSLFSCLGSLDRYVGLNRRVGRWCTC